VDTVVLASQDSVPVVRLSGVTWLEDGRIAIADVSEGNVKVYGADGRLLQVIGRRGRGPGEFEQVRYPILLRDGRWVAGEATGVVSFFGADGTYLRRIRLQPNLGISSLSVLPSGRFVVTGWPYERGVVALYDSTGRELKRFLPMRRPPVTDQPANPRWSTALQYWSVVRGDEALVLSTLSDSLWKVNLESGHVSASSIALSDYERPKLPDQASPDDRRDPFAWVKAFHTSVSLLQDRSGAIGVSLVKGILHYGDPALFYFQNKGSRRVIRDLTPVLAIRGNEVLTLHRPKGGVVVLARYRWLG
jgi:hypothetical protein